MSHLYLGIDTATPYLALALWSDRDGVLARSVEDVGRDHGARVLPELERLFRGAGVAPAAVSAIGVGVGPGSYTGVRIGIATAKGLARAWQVPLGGASSLAALAFGALAPGATGVAALDARRGQVYAAAFRRPDDAAAVALVTLRAAAKLPRSGLSEALDGLPIHEGGPPDAVFTASRAVRAAPTDALYL